MNDLFSADALISLLTLTILEIVLGVDNVIFVSIIMGRLDQAKQKTARRIWMFTGVLVRVLLLLSLTWLVKNGNATLFAIGDKEFNLRGLIMLGGGLFLLTKTVGEIHQKLEGAEHETTSKNKGGNLVKIVIQMMLVDTVFSFDSIITAVGMAQHVEIMITAVVVAMFIMFLFSGKIADFVEKHPTVKMLALSFLVMIGCVLLIEGWDAEKAHDLHLKNYVYFSMAFSFAVELLNLQLRKKSKAVELREPHLDDIDEGSVST
ncbi:MAG: TerC family protein [Chitinophagaceae bacterium]|nr:TerC family protein [Chitinophagaceae bacterium]